MYYTVVSSAPGGVRRTRSSCLVFDALEAYAECFPSEGGEEDESPTLTSQIYAGHTMKQRGQASIRRKHTTHVVGRGDPSSPSALTKVLGSTLCIVAAVCGFECCRPRFADRRLPGIGIRYHAKNIMYLMRRHSGAPTAMAVFLGCPLLPEQVLREGLTATFIFIDGQGSASSSSSSCCCRRYTAATATCCRRFRAVVRLVMAGAGVVDEHAVLDPDGGVNIAVVPLKHDFRQNPHPASVGFVPGIESATVS